MVTCQTSPVDQRIWNSGASIAKAFNMRRGKGSPSVRACLGSCWRRNEGYLCGAEAAEETAVCVEDQAAVMYMNRPHRTIGALLLSLNGVAETPSKATCKIPACFPRRACIRHACRRGGMKEAGCGTT